MANIDSSAGAILSYTTQLLNGIKIVADQSKSLGGWSLTIIGGSILALVSTSYAKPVNKKVRLAYLLFIPGWFFLALSSYYGHVISERLMAAFLTTRPDVIRGIIDDHLSKEFSNQILYFKIGLSVFTAWLCIYLIWWIFFEHK